MRRISQMSDTIERIAKHLEAQRETQDPISEARRERGVDESKVVEALRRLRAAASAIAGKVADPRPYLQDKR